MEPQASRPTALIIDPDAEAGNQLGQLLTDRRERPEVMTTTSVEAAEQSLRTEYMAWLFIRICVWDDYQKLASALHHPPGRVVFLSPGRENCTGNLPEILDAHLKPPYSAGKLCRIWSRLTHPGFRPRPLDFFFLKSQCRYAIIRYADLRQVRWRRGKLQIYTQEEDFEVKGSLVEFQGRLPNLLTRVGRNWLVNERY